MPDKDEFRDIIAYTLSGSAGGTVNRRTILDAFGSMEAFAAWCTENDLGYIEVVQTFPVQQRG